MDVYLCTYTLWIFIYCFINWILSFEKHALFLANDDYHQSIIAVTFCTNLQNYLISHTNSRIRFKFKSTNDDRIWSVLIRSPPITWSKLVDRNIRVMAEPYCPHYWCHSDESMKYCTHHHYQHQNYPSSSFINIPELNLLCPCSHTSTVVC